MDFNVPCECGRSIKVSGGDAGSQVRCAACSRSVEVPSLHQLRKTAGIATLSADVVIETLQRENRLPEEQHCMSCGEATDGVRYADIYCERAVVRKENNGAAIIVGLLFGLLIGWILYRMTVTKRVIGENIAYRLPVRICPKCGQNLNDQGIEKLFRKVPLYAALLVKYSNSRIKLARTNLPA